MRFDYEGKTYSLTFQYERDSVDSSYGHAVTSPGKQKGIPRVTKCRIIALNNPMNKDDMSGEVIAEGIVKCHWKEQCNKSEGRRLALIKALSEPKVGFRHELMGREPRTLHRLRRSFRIAVWEKYWNRDRGYSIFTSLPPSVLNKVAP